MFNQEILENWKQQLLLLKKVTKSSSVFLVELNITPALVIASTENNSSKYSKSNEISTHNFGLNDILNSKKIQFNEATIDNSSCWLCTTPILLENENIWGAIVLILKEIKIGKNDILNSSKTFAKTISDQIQLQDSKRNNKEPFANIHTLFQLLKPLKGVPFLTNKKSNEFTFLDEQTKEVFGYNIKEWKYLDNWSKYIHPNDKQKVIDLYSNEKKVLDKYDSCFRILKKDGCISWIRNIIAPNFDQNNDINEWVGFMFDISDIKKEEFDSKILNKQLKLILKATNTIFNISDENGNIIFHSHEDYKEISHKCYKHFRGLDQKCNDCPRLNKDKKISNFIYTHNNRTFQVSALPYEIRPNVWNVAEVRFDITQRVKDEKKIAELKNRLEFSMKAGNIAYIKYNLNTSILNTNDIFREITGFLFNNEKVDIEWIKSRIHKEDIPYILDLYHNHSDDNNSKLTAEFRILNSENKYIWVRFSGQQININNSINEIIGILIDITDTKELMNALLVERNKSLQASEAKSMFLANMSHEIRTPMNAIIGFSELLSKHINKSPLTGYLNSIKASGKVLLALINDLLDLEKIEAGKMIIRKENTDFIELIKEIEQTFYMNFIEKEIELLVKIQSNFPRYINIDSLKIKQLLLNLVNNALKFTQKGEVNIKCSFMFDKDDQNKGTLSLIVSDTGIGISKSKQATIFEPFIQDKDANSKEHEGTGLGLSIVQKIVRMMGGIISLESKPNVGSSFTIIIPSIEATNDPFDDLISGSESNMIFNGEKILIVDSIKTNRDVLYAMCTNLNLVCHCCDYNNQIFDEVLSFKPDLMVMDIRLPKKNNFEIFNQIKNNNEINRIPIIAMSSSNNENESNLAQSKGFEGFISKPIPEKQLIKELSKFINPKETSEERIINIDDKKKIFSDDEKQLINEYLNTSVIPIWQSLSEILSSEKLVDFAKELKILLNTVDWPNLEAYLMKLEIAIKSFDFEAIQKLINQFNTYLDEIK